MPTNPESTEPKEPLSKSEEQGRKVDEWIEGVSKKETKTGSEKNITKLSDFLNEGETIEKPQQEKSPTDIDLDIDAAKKYLDEVYGKEKPEVGAVKSPVQEEVQKPKLFVPEEIGQKRTSEQIEEYKKIREEGEKILEKKKETDKRESVPSALDLAYERAKKPDRETTKENPIIIGEVERKQQQELAEKAKTAKNELIDLAKGIKEARERKEREAEASLLEKAKEVFEAVTGENLEKTAKEKAKIEAESEGLKVVTPEDYRKENTAKAQERARQKERSVIIGERWDMLSDKEKEKYFNGAKNKNDAAAIDSARMNFATELKGKIDAKKQELSKGKNGIVISEDTFYELMRKGLKSEDIKRKGFFGRILSGGEIGMPSLDKKDERGHFVSNRDYLAKIEARVKKTIENAAQEEIERKIIEGQARHKSRRQRQAGEILKETAAKYEAEKKEKEVEEIKKPKLEIVSIIGKIRTPGQMREMEKIRKQVEIDIEKRKESKKKIEELIKKQKKGQLLTAKEVSYLRAMESAQKTEKESKKSA